MPLPSGLLKIQISGDLRTFSAGATSKGRVQIFATAPLYAPGQNVILTPAQPITAAIAANGTFLSDEFISPGDPGVSPQDMPLLVVVRTPTYNDQWYVQVPADASGVIDLADLPRSNTAPAMVTYALVSQLLEYIPRALVDAKGDLIVATADGTLTRLPAGSNGQVLASDSAQATGLRWLTGGGGGGVTDHGELTGLTPDDDHPQYLTSGRGDARYVQPGQLATVATTGAYVDLTGTPAIPTTKADIGLPNVDNTSDAAKPVSSATQTALNTKVNLSLVDAAGDLLVGSGADTLTRLAKGSNGQVLGVDAGALAWTTPAGGGSGDLDIYEPATAGLLDWTADPVLCDTDYPHNNGVLLMVRFRYRGDAADLSEIGFCVASGASGPGAYSGVALYEDGAGTVNRLGQSADAGASWGSQGVKSVPLTAPVAVTRGNYYRAAILWQGAGAGRIAGVAATFLDALLNAGIRRSTYLTGQVDFPASINVAAMTTNNAMYWLGVK